MLENKTGLTSSGKNLPIMVAKLWSRQVKCIRYIYFATAINQQAAIDAYSTSAQGFFVKPASLEEIKETIDVMINTGESVLPRIIFNCANCTSTIIL